MKKPRGPLFWALAVLVPLLLLGAILAPFGYKTFKTWRADRLLDQSLALTEEGDYEKAFRKAMSAHFLKPEDDAILLVLANAAIDYRHGSALKYWPEVVGSPVRSPEDLKKYVDFLIRIRQPDEAAKYITTLVNELPDDLDVGLMHIRILRHQRKYSDAIILARNWIDRGYDSPQLHRLYVDTLFEIPYDRFRVQAIEFLQSMADREDESGLMALRYLVRLPDLEGTDRERYLEEISAHPLAERSDRLFALRESIERGDNTWEALKPRIFGLFDLEKTEDLVELAGFLNTMGLFAEVDALLDQKKAMTDHDLYMEYMAAKLQVGDASKVYDLTLLPPDQNPLSRIENLLMRAEALRILNRRIEFIDTLTLMAEVVEMEDFPGVERFLASGGHWDILKKLYLRLLDNERTQTLGKRKLISAYYYLGEEGPLLELLESIDMEDFSGDPSMNNFVAYLNILHRVHVPESRAAIEDLVATFPDTIDFRLTLGLYYLLTGDPETAARMIERMPELPETTPRYFYVSTIAILSANGQHEMARKLLQKVDLTNILPRERQLLMQAQQRWTESG